MPYACVSREPVGATSKAVASSSQKEISCKSTATKSIVVVVVVFVGCMKIKSPTISRICKNTQNLKGMCHSLVVSPFYRSSSLIWSINKKDENRRNFKKKIILHHQQRTAAAATGKTARRSGQSR